MIIELDSVCSTNTWLMQKVRAGHKGPLAVIAKTQSAGRGRGSHTFYSPPGGAYLSVLIKPTTPPERMYTITISAAAKTAQCISQLYGITPDIKWTNDLMYGGKKLCGILVQGLNVDGRWYAVVGIGVNVMSEKLPEEAASLSQFVNNPAPPKTLAALIAKTLQKPLDFADDFEYYKSHLITLGKKVRYLYNRETIEGIAADLLDDGALVIQTKSGPITARFGEVERI